MTNRHPHRPLTAVRLGVALLLTGALGGAARAAAPEQIGSWVIDCPASPPAGGCLMRAGTRFLDKGGITGDLEVQAQDQALVPVITVRGLPRELLLAAAMAGKPTASIQFPGGSAQPLACAATALAYVCAPADQAAGRALAAGLPTAAEVSVQVSLSVSGLKTLPAQRKSLPLSGTQAALQRLRAAGPTPLATPVTDTTPPRPADLMVMADKLLRAAGYPDGVAKLQSLMAKYLRK